MSRPTPERHILRPPYVTGDRARYPDLERKSDLAYADLEPSYDDYVSTVSTPDCAISLELASVHAL